MTLFSGNEIDYSEKLERYNAILYQTSMIQIGISQNLFARIKELTDNDSNIDLSRKSAYIEKLLKQANDLQERAILNLKESMIFDKVVKLLTENTDDFSESQ